MVWVNNPSGWQWHSSVELGNIRPKIEGRRHRMDACRCSLNMSVASLLSSFRNLEANKRGRHWRTKPAQAITLPLCFPYGFFLRLALVVKLGPLLSFRPKKRILKRTHVMDGLPETSPSTEVYSQACPVMLAR